MGKRQKKRRVFKLDLKVCKVFGDVTSDGKPFHAFAAATGKDQSPIVWSRVGGTASAEVEDE